MRVLVTRPAGDADRTAAIVQAHGHRAILAPLFIVKPYPHAPMGQADAYTATSANALRALSFAGINLSKPLFAVGNATANEAAQRGFLDVRSADGDGDDLCRLVRSELQTGASLTYITGKPRNDAAIKALEQTYTITTLETYETVAADILPITASAGLLEGELDAVLHFSPRAAVVFAALVDQAGLAPQANQLLHVFISHAAEQHRFSRRAVAAKPTLEAMLKCLG